MGRHHDGVGYIPIRSREDHEKSKQISQTYLKSFKNQPQLSDENPMSPCHKKFKNQITFDLY